jgi:MHS family proline/betaine transporter-like MFS transporter
MTTNTIRPHEDHPIAAELDRRADSSSHQLRAISASVIGNALEWFDFTVYAFLAAIIGKHFFPSTDETTALLSSFAVFGVGFVARPLGGVLIGLFGDRMGRKPALLLTIVMMAAGTGLIGVLPTYASIGVAAPILLVIARLLQGFSAGGEWGGSASFLVEWAPPHRRGFFGSFHPASIFLGQLSGLGTTALVTSAIGSDAMSDWGWRIPFLIGALVGPLGLLIRRTVDETPAFRRAAVEAPAAGEEPAIWHSLIHAFCFVAVQSVVVYTFFSYFPTFMQKYLHLSASQALWSTTFANGMVMLTCLAAGALSDRIGRKPLMLVHCLAFLVLTYPLMALLLTNGASLTMIVVIQAFLGLLTGLFLGSFPAALVEFFPTRRRLTGLGTAYNLSSMVFGGFAPFIATWLINATGSPIAVSGYVMFAALLSTVAVWRLRETAHTTLR